MNEYDIREWLLDVAKEMVEAWQPLVPGDRYLFVLGAQPLVPCLVEPLARLARDMVPDGIAIAARWADGQTTLLYDGGGAFAVAQAERAVRGAT